MKLKVGDILYYSTSKRRCDGIMIGQKVVKTKITKINKVTFEHSKNWDKMRIDKIGELLYLTERECIEDMINMSNERLRELEDSVEVVQYKEIPKNIKSLKLKLRKLNAVSLESVQKESGK